jgi:hypothetical protein
MLKPAPASIAADRGAVEYAALGEGPALLALHGAAGGYDQKLLPARSIGSPWALQLAFRYPQRCWAPVLASIHRARIATRLPLLYHLLPLIARSARLRRLFRTRRARHLDRDRHRGVTDPALRTDTLRDPEVGPLVCERVLSACEGFRAVGWGVSARPASGSPPGTLRVG